MQGAESIHPENSQLGNFQQSAILGNSVAISKQYCFLPETTGNMKQHQLLRKKKTFGLQYYIESSSFMKMSVSILCESRNIPLFLGDNPFIPLLSDLYCKTVQLETQ